MHTSYEKLHHYVGVGRSHGDKTSSSFYELSAKKCIFKTSIEGVHLPFNASVLASVSYTLYLSLTQDFIVMDVFIQSQLPF